MMPLRCRRHADDMPRHAAAYAALRYDAMPITPLYALLMPPPLLFSLPELTMLIFAMAAMLFADAVLMRDSAMLLMPMPPC